MGHDPGIVNGAPPNSEAIRDTAARLVAAGHLDDVLAASFAHLFVDEYQDCSICQHSLVTWLAQSLPTAIVEIPFSGSVAKTIAEDGRTGINWIRSPLCGGIGKSGNEDRLSSDIASADLSNLPLPDHRHRFETCQCSSGGSEPAEAEPSSDQTLDAPMILLDNIIQILALPETRTAPELAVSLHLRDRPWIGAVLVDRERGRIDGVRLRERLAENRFAAAVSRRAANRKSIVCPRLSTAR